MTTVKTDIRTQEHTGWTNSLLLYKEEMEIMQRILEELAYRDSSGDNLARIEKFRDRILTQQEFMAELGQEIARHQLLMENETGDAAYRDILGEEIKDFEKIFNSLRTEFNTFLTQKM